MLEISVETKNVARVDEDRSWSFVPGDEIVPGVHAWALLGDGRHCETWLAWNVCLWSAVTIKLPRPNRIDERTRSALRREAQAVSSLLHPGIQRLLEADCDGDLPYLVFEYVEGPTLAEMLDEKGGLNRVEVIRLGMQIAAALHYIHGKGIVHGDVKPGNVVLRDGRAVLIDFDIARAIGEGGAGMKARGSARYMPPEQIQGEPGAASWDLFALGATLYEAATDVIVFDFDEKLEGFVHPQLTRRPAPLRSINAAIPEKLDRAVLSLLEADPQRRPPTAMAALSLLAGALPKKEQCLWPRWASKLMSDTAPGFCAEPVKTPKQIHDRVEPPAALAVVSTKRTHGV